ncbi:MAG: site-2 protease family protein [Oscillospiraceae bacterium]|nr:site-2 protease family protein [Oscillospiraceae bacterium]
MQFKLFGTKIYISFIFAAVITVMLFFDRTTLFLPSAIAIILHELGHLFAMWLCECTPKEIKLIPASVQIIRGFSSKPYGESIIALFGPIVNLVIFLVFLVNYLYFKDEWVIKFGLINLIIGIFNLLPVKGLDGGTVLYNIVSEKKGLRTAERLLNIITFVSSLTLFVLGIFTIINGKVNITVFIMAIYLLLSVVIKI